MLHGLPDITRRSSSDGASPIAMTHNPTMSNKSRGQQPKRRALDSDSDDTDAKVGVVGGGGGVSTCVHINHVMTHLSVHTFHIHESLVDNCFLSYGGRQKREERKIE